MRTLERQQYIFSFIFRLYCDNILDYFGCICGIPLFHFKSNIVGWNISNVSDTFIDRNTEKSSCKVFFVVVVNNILFISGLQDPKPGDTQNSLKFNFVINMTCCRKHYVVCANCCGAAGSFRKDLNKHI